MTSLEDSTRPGCLGFIDLHYDEGCHMCDYASMCAYIVVTEKWNDKESKAEDTQEA